MACDYIPLFIRLDRIAGHSLVAAKKKTWLGDHLVLPCDRCLGALVCVVGFESFFTDGRNSLRSNWLEMDCDSRIDLTGMLI